MQFTSRFVSAFIVCLAALTSVTASPIPIAEPHPTPPNPELDARRCRLINACI